MKRRAWLLLAALLPPLATAHVVRAQAPGAAPTTSGWGPAQPIPPPTPPAGASTGPVPIVILPAPTAPPTSSAPPAATLVIVQQAPPPPPPPPPPPRRTEDDEDEGRQRTSLKIELGAAYRRVHGIEVGGGAFIVGAGAQNNRFGHYATFNLFYGATDLALRTTGIFGGYNFDVRAGIVRLGLGIEGGYLIIRRASLDKRLYALGAGGFGHIGVDVVTFGDRKDKDEGALYLDVRLSGTLHAGNAGFWGPSIALGFRM